MISATGYTGYTTVETSFYNARYDCTWETSFRDFYLGFLAMYPVSRANAFGYNGP